MNVATLNYATINLIILIPNVKPYAESGYKFLQFKGSWSLSKYFFVTIAK